MKPSRNIRADSGFSIIELSIILVVLAFVLTNMLLITENKRETTRSIDTYQKMDRLQETLTQYVKAKGHYPCPADGRARINTDTYGRGLGTGTGTCQTMEENPALGIFRVKDTAYANGFNDMVIGVVPTVDLALPSTYGVDQWGSRITYGVIQRFTKKGDYAATMDGDIKILNEDGTLNSKSAYVLVSHGPNAVGAWPFAGGTNAGRIPSPTSPPTYIGAELENHHMDTNQFDKEFFRAGKPDPNAEGNDILFDDIVRYQVPEQYYGQDTSVDGKAFSPESIPGLVLWLDAKDKENIDMNTSNSNNVMTWKDRTSIFNNSEANDAVTVTNGQRPTYRKAPVGTSPTPGIAGKPAITFSQGSNDVLKIVGTAANNSLSFDTPYNKAMTLFFVAKSTEGLADQSIKTMFSKETIGASPLGWGLGSLETANNLFGFHIGDPTDDARRVKKTGFDQSQNHIVAVTVDASGNVFLYDGCTEIASTGLTPIDVTAMGLNNLFDAYVGASNAAGSNSFNGDIAEVIIYNEVLTPSDRVAVTKYLNTRWNLSYNTGSCPTTINCLANQDPVGATCSTNSTCCSGECVSGKCCVRVGYLGKGQACTKNSDCCDGRAVCTGYGFCWIPPLN